MRDPLLWVVFAAFFVITVPYGMPWLDPETVTWFGDLYGFIPLIVADVVAILAGLRTLDDRERTFWRFIAAALGFNLVVPLIYQIEALGLARGDLSIDLVYVLFYFCLILAVRSRPDRPRGPAGDRASFVENVATAVFLSGLFVYFIVIKEPPGENLYADWVPSLFLYWTLDLFLAATLLYNHQTATDARWRATYAWLALAALGWAFTDGVEAFIYREWLPDVPGESFLNALWYFPYVWIGVAARARVHGWPRALSRLGWRPREAGSPAGRLGVVVVYALVLPVLHFSLYLTHVLGPEVRDARALAVLVFLVPLLAIAFWHQRALHFRAAELERAQDVLERQRAVLAAAAEQTDQAILLADAEDRIAYVNPAWERAVGVERERLLGRAAPEVMALLGPDAVELYEGAPDEGAAVAHLLREVQGRTVEEELTVVPVYEAGRLTHRSASLRDVTNESRLERQLRQAQRMEALGTLAGGIAHDFNNVLAAILGYAEFLEERVAEHPEFADDVAEILKAARRAKGLTTQILTFSRQEDADRKPMYLGAVVDEVMKLVSPTIPSSVACRCRTPQEVGLVVAEEVRLHQVVLNLVTNALQAMGEKGSLTISVKETTPGSVEDGRVMGDLGEGPYAVLEVSDTGGGIDHDTLERMWDPFFTTKEFGHGTGLGLSVVHGVVMALGGAIGVTSEPGAGTTFRVYLPLAEEVAPEEPAAPGQHGETAHVGGRVLVVDDEEPVVRVVSLGLEAAGFLVSRASGSPQALELFSAHPAAYDALVTDQTMPGLTGLELATACRQVRPDLPVVLMTGYSEAVTPETMAAAGVSEVLLKPVSRMELVRAVRNALEAGRAPEAR